MLFLMIYKKINFFLILLIYSFKILFLVDSKGKFIKVYEFDNLI